MYAPETVAVIRDKVENSFKNHYPGRITDTFTVYDRVGNVLFNQVFNLGNMFDPSRVVTAYWNIGRVLPGNYRVTAVVREDGNIVAQSECAIEVAAYNNTDIRGALDISQKTVRLGEDVDMKYTLQNFGADDIDKANALISVIDPETLRIVFRETKEYEKLLAGKPADELGGEPQE